MVPSAWLDRFVVTPEAKARHLRTIRDRYRGVPTRVGLLEQYEFASGPSVIRYRVDPLSGTTREVEVIKQGRVRSLTRNSYTAVRAGVYVLTSSVSERVSEAGSRQTVSMRYSAHVLKRR